VLGLLAGALVLAGVLIGLAMRTAPVPDEDSRPSSGKKRGNRR
jgi:hypothetical protein